MGELAPPSAPMILQGLSHQHLHPWEWNPVGNSRFSHKAGAPASPPARLHKKGNPLWLLIKGCALPSLTWPERGLHPSVSEWVSNCHNYNLLELAIKGCLEICSSLQIVNTVLLILILNIQFADCDLITYVNIPPEPWFWANNLTWTVFPLNKVYPFTICYPTGWRKIIISKLWGGLCPFQELPRMGHYFQSSVEMWLALQSQGLPKWTKNKIPPLHKELRTNAQY